jgi:hypothetical protein
MHGVTTQNNNIVMLGVAVLTAVSMKMAAFWVVAPCRLV